MEKKSVLKELNKIFILFRACVDKDYLNSLIDKRGLSNRVAFKKEADSHLDNFGRVFSALLKEGAGDVMLVSVIQDYVDSFETKISKRRRPKSDPTQEKAIQRLMEKRHDEDSDQLSKEVKNLNIWDRAIRDLLAVAFGNEGKGKWKSEAEIDGKTIKNVLFDSSNLPVLSLDSLTKGLNNFAMSKIQSAPGHMDKHDVRDWMMMYVFFPGAVEKKLKDQAEDEGVGLQWSSKKPVTEYIAKEIEQTDQEDLPLDITSILMTNLNSAYKDFQKFVVKKEMPSKEKFDEKYKNLKTEIDNLKGKKDKSDKEEKEIKDKEEKLSEIFKKIKDLTPGDLGLQHQKVDDEDDSMPDISMIADPMDLVNENFESPQMKKDFETYVERKGTDKTKKLVSILLSGKADKDLGSPGSGADFMKKLEITNPQDFKKMVKEVILHLANFAIISDLPKLWKGIVRRNKVPARYEDRKNQFEELKSQQKKSSYMENKVAGIVSYLEVLSKRV